MNFTYSNDHSCENQPPKQLLKKDDFSINKINENQYYVEFMIENNGLNMISIVNFDILKLVYDLNTDIYEKSDLQKINETEAVITLVLKPLFADLGLPQRYVHLHMTKTTDLPNQTVYFTGHSVSPDPIILEQLSMVSAELEPLPVEKISVTCRCVKTHQLCISYVMQLHKKKIKIPVFVEKGITMIIYKMFSKIKQFIENVC